MMHTWSFHFEQIKFLAVQDEFYLFEMERPGMHHAFIYKMSQCNCKQGVSLFNLEFAGIAGQG